MHLEALTEEGKKLFSSLAKFDGFYLAGGTALALQVGHRVSADFDLFRAEPVDKTLLAKIKRVFPTANISPLVNNPEELSVYVSGVKFTFLHYPFPVLEPLVNYNNLDLLSPRELAATKAYTIGRRGDYKDYADMYFYLTSVENDLSRVIALARRKYGPEFNDRLFLEQLVFLDDIAETKLQFLKPAPDKQTISNFFQNRVAKLEL